MKGSVITMWRFFRYANWNEPLLIDLVKEEAKMAKIIRLYSAKIYVYC